MAVATPAATAYKKPDTTFEQTDVQTKDSDSYITDNSLASNQLNKVMSQDSPLMQMAQTKAQQTANANGNLNTSMANTAAIAGMADAGLQVAQQDAATYGQAALNKQTTENTGAATTQQSKYGLQQQNNAGLLAGALADQTYGNSASLKSLENDLSKDYYNSVFPMEKELAQMGYEAALKQTSMTTGAAISQTLADTLGSLMGDEDVTDLVSARDALVAITQEALTW